MQLRKFKAIMVLQSILLIFAMLLSGCRPTIRYGRDLEGENLSDMRSVIKTIPRGVWKDIMQAHILETDDNVSADFSDLEDAPEMEIYSSGIFCYKLSNNYYLYFWMHFDNDKYDNKKLKLVLDTITISFGSLEESVLFLDRDEFPEALEIVKSEFFS